MNITNSDHHYGRLRCRERLKDLLHIIFLGGICIPFYSGGTAPACKVDFWIPTVNSTVDAWFAPAERIPCNPLKSTFPSLLVLPSQEHSWLQLFFFLVLCTSIARFSTKRTYQLCIQKYEFVVVCTSWALAIYNLFPATNLQSRCLRRPLLLQSQKDREINSGRCRCGRVTVMMLLLVVEGRP
jgi:hypothetical protein